MNTSRGLLIWELSDEPCIVDLYPLFQRMVKVRDLRKAKGKRYPLWALLDIAVLARLAGQQHAQAIAQWARLRAVPLCRLFGLWRHRMPALRTWDRVFSQGLDADELDRIVCDYLYETFHTPPQEGRLCAAIDGKTLRGTIWAGNPQGVHLLAIYLPHNGVVLAQMEVKAKANEISSAPQLLRQVDLHGIVLTGDAMFTQRKLSLQVVEAGGDYLWDVKGNQPQLQEDIATLFDENENTAVVEEFGTACTSTVGHGRSEKRTLTSSSLLKGYSHFPHLEQVFQIETEVTDLTTNQSSQQIRYGVTSLPPERASPKDLLAYVQQHWGIESGLHYRRDVTLGEDRIRARINQVAHVHAILNNIAVAFLHHSPISMAYGLRCTSYKVERLVLGMCST